MGQHCTKLKKLTIPLYPSQDADDRGHHFDISTYEWKLVSDYTGLTFAEIQELNILVYWQFLRDAFIFEHMKTDEGNQYLADAERLTSTEPDRASIRNFNQGGL